MGRGLRRGGILLRPLLSLALSSIRWRRGSDSFVPSFRDAPIRNGHGWFVLLSLFLCVQGSFAQEQLQLTIDHFTEPEQVVKVSFEGVPNTSYRIHGSRDLLTWERQEILQASSENATLTFLIPINEASSLFFRVEVEVPAFHPPEHMVRIEPGEFVMGSPSDEEGRFLDKEEPQTAVTLTQSYWISKYEVTQEEFENVLGFNPSQYRIFDDPRLPVESVTWFDALDYCFELTLQERNAGRLPEDFEYRLPTEAEWAYAARAGTTTRFSYGHDPGYQHLSDYAWYAGNSGLRPHPVGQKLPNPWGLYDMHGNVFEWCSDWFGQLPGGSGTDPQGPSEGIDRIIRGGYWDGSPPFCRSALRVHYPPRSRISYLGFRVVLAKTPEP